MFISQQKNCQLILPETQHGHKTRFSAAVFMQVFFNGILRPEKPSSGGLGLLSPARARFAAIEASPFSLTPKAVYPEYLSFRGRFTH